MSETPFEISYIAETYQRYPGEEATFWLRLDVVEPLSGQGTVRIILPAQIEAVPLALQYAPSPGEAQPQPLAPTFSFATDPQAKRYQTLTWHLDEVELRPGHPLEFKVVGKIGFCEKQTYLLKSWAEASLLTDTQETTFQTQSEVVAVQIQAKAAVMKYLPALYQDPDHELLWRYLMVFDRVWSHYDEFLTNQPAYFDPHLTPPEWLPDLAEWVGLAWSPFVPEAIKQRVTPALMPQMVELHLKRGTVAGLIQYLQVWMGIYEADVNHCIQVEENRAGNFVLSDKTELSNALVMGSNPKEVCEFTVRLLWPTYCERLPRSFIEQLVEAWKPAYTVYKLIEEN